MRVPAADPALARGLRAGAESAPQPRAEAAGPAAVRGFTPAVRGSPGKGRPRLPLGHGNDIVPIPATRGQIIVLLEPVSPGSAGVSARLPLQAGVAPGSLGGAGLESVGSETRAEKQPRSLRYRSMRKGNSHLADSRLPGRSPCCRCGAGAAPSAGRSPAPAKLCSQALESLTAAGQSLPAAELDPGAPRMLRGPSAFLSVKWVLGGAPAPEISGFLKALLELENPNFPLGFFTLNHGFFSPDLAHVHAESFF